MKQDSNEIARSIRLPSDVWEAFVQDANRCRRSANKHLEAVLVQYLGLEDTKMREVVPNEKGKKNNVAAVN